MKKIIAHITMLLCFVSRSVGQEVQVSVNDDKIKYNSTYGYYPNYINIKVSDKEAEYKIVSGEVIASDIDNKRVRFRATIDSSTVITEGISRDMKVLIEIKKIQKAGGAVQNFNKFFMFKVDHEPIQKVNKYFDVLINDSVTYRTMGLESNRINSARIVAENIGDKDTIQVLHRRGPNIRATIRLPYKEFKEYKIADFLKGGIPGDWFVFTLRMRKRNLSLAIHCV